MFAQLYWIETEWPGRLAILARPRGGDWLADEVETWSAAGLDAVVSLLTPSETHELGLDREREYCAARGIEFHAYPIEDRGVPKSAAQVVALVHQLQNLLRNGRNVGVHCRQGIGRSGLLAAAVLIEDGTDPGEALARINRTRGLPIPETAEQRAWIEAFPGVSQATSARRVQK